MAVCSKALLLADSGLSPLFGFESQSRPRHVRKLPVTWGQVVVSQLWFPPPIITGYLQLDMAEKVTKKRNSNFQM